MMFTQEHLFSMLILEIHKSTVYCIELYLIVVLCFNHSFMYSIKNDH
jgi:hypothetical protein